MNKFLRLILLLIVVFGQRLGAQTTSLSSINQLGEYTEQFGIQFAYSPEFISSINLADAQSLNELRTIFEQADVEVMELSINRWLLKRKKEDPTPSTLFINGEVTDSKGQPLISALIYNSSTTHSTLTDENGAFFLELAEEDEICCQYLGYKVQCTDIDADIRFTMEPDIQVIDDVQIETKKVFFTAKPLADNEKIRIKESNLKNASLGKDVIRSVQMLGGVDATDDLSASLRIRGSLGLQSLITLDGIPIYSPESSFGMFSVLNPLSISQATLYKNAMPLDYGEYTGGYLECKGLTNIQDRVKLNLDLNTLQTMGAIQIPIGKSSQISAAFRRSNGAVSNSQYYSQLRMRRNPNTQIQNLFNRPETISTDLENRFGDLYINFSHEWKNGQSFQATLFGNRDISGTSYAQENPLFNRDSVIVALLSESYDQDKEKQNAGLSLRYQKEFNTGGLLSVLFYGSNYRLDDRIRSNVTIDRRLNTQRANYDSRIQNNVQDQNFKFQFESSEKRNWRWKLGVDFRRIHTDFRFRVIDSLPIRQKLRVPSATPYAGLIYNYKNLFVAEIGMRNAWIPARSPINFASPRSKIMVRLKEGWYLKSSASFNQQYFRPIELERQLGQSTSVNIIANGEIPPMQSAQLTLGTNYFKSGFKINADLYLRQNNGIVEQVLSFPGIALESNVFGNNSYRLFNGINKVAGLDVTAGYEKEAFVGLLSYTLSKSEDQFEEIFNNTPLPDQNNRLHQFNGYLSYQLNSWILSSNYIFGSGIYTLNRAIIEQNIDRERINPSNLLRQLPSYRRLDFNVSYHLPVKRGSFYFDFGIFNVLNRENISTEIFLFTVQEDSRRSVGASEVSLLGRVVSLGLRYEL